MTTLDDEIARHLQKAAESGELSSAESYGKPLIHDSGWDETPESLRMPFKILKDAGVVPHEVAMFHERARLRAALEAASSPQERQDAQQRLSDLEQKLALRLESLRRNASL